MGKKYIEKPKRFVKIPPALGESHIVPDIIIKGEMGTIISRYKPKKKNRTKAITSYPFDILTQV